MLVVLAPGVALIRWWQRRRRGGASIVRWTVGVLDGREGRYARLDLTVDVPAAVEPVARSALTDAVVRVAELLRRGDDLYHLVVGLPTGTAAERVAVGVRPQELGERLSRSLVQRSYRGRTLLWLAVARPGRMESLAAPADPEGPGQHDAAVAELGPRWAAATALGRGGAAAVIRAVLWVPEVSRPRVEEVLERLGRSLGGGAARG